VWPSAVSSSGRVLELFQRPSWLLRLTGIVHHEIAVRVVSAEPGCAHSGDCGCKVIVVNTARTSQRGACSACGPCSTWR
jgi:hypothetical protein